MTVNLRSQADVAYEALRDMIIGLQIPPGAPIAEAELTDRIGVGRTPLREAVNRLASERLVTIYPRRGTFASDINLSDLGLITDLRVELEGLAAERAAERATEAERTGLLGLAARVDASSAGAQMELDTAIHRAVYAAAHNHFLEDSATRYHNLAMRIWHLFVDRIPDLAAHVEEHVELVESIVACEAGRARAAAVAHVRRFEHAVRAVL